MNIVSLEPARLIAQELAAICGMSVPEWRRFINGKHMPTPRQLERLLRLAELPAWAEFVKSCDEFDAAPEA